MLGDGYEILVLFGFALLIAAEAIISRVVEKPAYDLASTELNLGVVFGWLVFSSLTAVLIVFCIRLGNQYALIEPGNGVFGYVLLFLVADFLYYSWHVLNHKFRWFWATHVVHHTAERINFLAALRQGWTDVLGGTWLFFAPLGLFGFSPEMCFVYFVVVDTWQLVVHNEWAGKLGPLEWVMVTPSNHRVHHSLKPEHVDKNFGGLLIIWDRLFGTYADEGAECLTKFGIANGPPPGAGVVDVVLWGWYPILSDARKFFGRVGLRKEQ